jgi:hypothetical protein
VRRAYRELSLQAHHDVGGDAERFIELETAHRAALAELAAAPAPVESPVGASA